MRTHSNNDLNYKLVLQAARDTMEHWFTTKSRIKHDGSSLQPKRPRVMSLFSSFSLCFAPIDWHAPRVGITGPFKTGPSLSPCWPTPRLQ